MNPISHLLASWTMADLARLDRRGRALVTLCGVLPDLDGLGVLIDTGNRILGRPGEWTNYGLYHHALLHGLPAAVAIPAIAALFARRRLKVFLVGFAAVHFHLLCDLVGSRGPDPTDIWPISYLAPFSDRLTLEWAGQWPLNAWPNIAFTIALLGYAFYRAVRSGYSPVGLFSARADAAFAATVRRRWESLRSRGS
jgi:inner membrane protein